MDLQSFPVEPPKFHIDIGIKPPDFKMIFFRNIINLIRKYWNMLNVVIQGNVVESACNV